MAKHKKIVYFIAGVSLVAMVWFVSREGYGIVINGNIMFPEYSGGQIYVTASSGKAVENFDPADLVIEKIPGPGPYRIMVPKNCGKVFLRASCGSQNYRWGLYSSVPFGVFSGNPLAIASDDVNNADITISLPDKKVMDSYQGQAVTVSGKIVFDGYKEGRIQIMAWSKDSKWGPPDIAVTEIAAPGPYSLRVPKGAGQIYIQARHCVSGRDGGPAGHSYFWPYRGELGISSVDREGIDILIPHRRSLF